jgi:hypothetical protein
MRCFFSRSCAIILVNLLLVAQAKAICPLCTVAAVAGIGLSRWFGVDDTITGLWIGGLLVSLSVWTVFWLDKKKIDFFAKRTIVTLAYYLITILPLYSAGIMGHPLNTLWGVDKLLLGIIIGSVFFFAGGMWYFYIKKHNNDKAYFPFQKVVMPLTPLIILSIVFHFIVNG